MAVGHFGTTNCSDQLPHLRSDGVADAPSGGIHVLALVEIPITSMISLRDWFLKSTEMLSYTVFHDHILLVSLSFSQISP